RPPCSRLLAGLLRDVNSVLENPRIEASDPGRQFDVRRGLPDGLDVRTREEDLVALHLDLRLSHDPSLARELLPEEILDDEFGTLHGRLHGEMAVHDFHLIRVPFRYPNDHIAEVGGEGSDERALPPAGVLAADLRLLALDDNLDSRVGELPAQRGPLRRHDDGIAVEPDLHASRHLDRSLQQTRDRPRPPQYT